MGLENVPGKMLAAQVVEYKKPYKIHQVATPKDLQPNDILLKTAVASYCHTDSMISSGAFGTELPCIASHEGSGTVAAVGSSVKSFKEGDRVMAGLYRDQCGTCADCQGPESFKQYCQFSKGAIGVNVDGAFAEYVVVDARNAVKLPDNVSFETAAPLACAGCTVWRGILQADLKKGEWLGIVGSGGGLGHLGVQFAKALGLNVVGVDARDEGLELTKKYGADVAVDARLGNEEVVRQVQAVTGGQGVDVTVNVSDAKGAAATACAMTKKHSRMIQIAQPEQVCVPFAELVFRDIRIQGSLIASPNESQRMIDTVSEHGITVTTNPFDGLQKLPELLDLVHSGKLKGKAIIIMDPEQIRKEKELAGGKLA